MMTEQYVQDCLQYLASQTDTRSKDGAGFNRIDAIWGYNLARLECLSPVQAIVAAKRLRKYRKQLEAGGFAVPALEDIEAYIQMQKTATVQETPRTAQEEAENEHKIYIEKKRIIIEYPYNKAIYGVIAPLKEKIADWQFNLFKRKDWSFPEADAHMVIDALAPFIDRFEIAPEVSVLIEQIRRGAEIAREQAELEAAIQRMETQIALETVQTYLDGEALSNGRILFEHQREAVRHLIEGKRVILAHDMGLGKTSSALVAAKAYGLPVIVVAPASLRINWLREAEMVQVGIEVWSWAKLPEPPETDFVLIGDECHYAQTLGTKRTADFLALAEQARAVFCLSGTPIKNGRPVNLFPLLVACKHPLAADEWKYKHRYCNAHKKSIGRKEVWDFTGASHLGELHNKTKEAILYKKKEECLDLPPKIRVMREAEVSKEAEKAYRAAIDLLRERHKQHMTQKSEERIAALMAELGDDVDEGTIKEELDALKEGEENARALVELGILRHAGSIAKVESAIAEAQEIMEQGGSIVLFCAYRDSAEQIAEALDASLLTGDTSTEQRQVMIDRFQAKEQRALVCTLGAGGVGITLTAAQTVVLVDRPWTPGDTAQAEDRLHRIGQQGSITAIWLQYGAIDAKIDALLQQKQERIDLVLRGKTGLRGIRSIRSLAKEIMESIHTHTDIDVEALAASQEAIESAIPTVEVPEITEEYAHEDGAEKQSKKDGRLKGKARRIRKNIMLDAEIVDFLESMKAPAQATTKDSGYSGFLEKLVKASAEFQEFKRSQPQ